MIVFDLKCASGHGFEGWFGSSADFADQRNRSLIQCPYCGNAEVEKAPQAANVAAKGNQRSEVPVSNALDAPADLIRKLAELQSKILADSTWVGSDFPDRARAMHYGEEDKAAIHGSATAEAVADMVDAGIALAPLPLPFIPPEERN